MSKTIKPYRPRPIPRVPENGTVGHRIKLDIDPPPSLKNITFGGNINAGLFADIGYLSEALKSSGKQGPNFTESLQNMLGKSEAAQKIFRLSSEKAGKDPTIPQLLLLYMASLEGRFSPISMKAEDMDLSPDDIFRFPMILDAADSIYYFIKSIEKNPRLKRALTKADKDFRRRFDDLQCALLFYLVVQRLGHLGNNPIFPAHKDRSDSAYGRMRKHIDDMALHIRMVADTIDGPIDLRKIAAMQRARMMLDTNKWVLDAMTETDPNFKNDISLSFERLEVVTEDVHRVLAPFYHTVVPTKRDMFKEPLNSGNYKDFIVRLSGILIRYLTKFVELGNSPPAFGASEQTFLGLNIDANDGIVAVSLIDAIKSNKWLYIGLRRAIGGSLDELIKRALIGIHLHKDAFIQRTMSPRDLTNIPDEKILPADMLFKPRTSAFDEDLAPIYDLIFEAHSLFRSNDQDVVHDMDLNIEHIDRQIKKLPRSAALLLMQLFKEKESSHAFYEAVLSFGIWPAPIDADVANFFSLRFGYVSDPKRYIFRTIPSGQAPSVDDIYPTFRANYMELHGHYPEEKEIRAINGTLRYLSNASVEILKDALSSSDPSYLPVALPSDALLQFNAAISARDRMELLYFIADFGGSFLSPLN